MEKRWRVASLPSDEMKERFPELHPIAVQLLWNRGLTTQEEVDEFLLPDYGQDLHDPFLFSQMEAACQRVTEAIEKGERVAVHGDYDADGITGSTILLSTFREAAKMMGGDPALFMSYIPHREKEGYGLRKDAVQALAKQGVGLLITVDHGISCAEEIAEAKKLGMDTIVVDHHQLPERLPECITLHPLVPGETYPFKFLAAAGVAFKFASGFIIHSAKGGHPFPAGHEKWLLDLVAIATVTDFMPLKGENRTLERYGLVVLNKTRRPGLKKIIESAGLKPGTLDTTSVGFYIGPRINAASRMEHADMALETLLAEDADEATVLADRLNRCNQARQRYTEKVMKEALVMIEGQEGKKVRIIIGDGWSAGIVGLVAGKLVTKLGVPVFVLGKEGDRIVGSGRSIPEFNLMEALEHGKAHLARYGGHPQACGLTIHGDGNVREFTRLVEEFADEVLSEEDLCPAIDLDGEISLADVTWELVGLLERFEPFGEGNPRPLFKLIGVIVASVKPVGKTGAHARIEVRDEEGRKSTMIAFGMKDRTTELMPGTRIDAVVEIGVNEWNGTRRIQLRVVDLCPQKAIAIKPENELCQTAERN